MNLPRKTLGMDMDYAIQMYFTPLSELDETTKNFLLAVRLGTVALIGGIAYFLIKR